MSLEKKVVSNTKIFGLDHLVETKLRDYFNHLGEDLPAVDLYDLIIGEVERPLLKAVLESASWNKLKAAEILGINRNTLAKKIAVHGLQKPERKAS